MEDYISNCGHCILRKPISRMTPLVNIVTSQLLKLVCIDYLTLEGSKCKVKYILVINEHFTMYGVVIPRRNQTACTTAEGLFNHFVIMILRSVSILTRAWTLNPPSSRTCTCGNSAGNEKFHTIPHHPSGNSQCESFNRTTFNMLGTCSPDQKRVWKKVCWSCSPLVQLNET